MWQSFPLQTVSHEEHIYLEIMLQWSCTIPIFRRFLCWLGDCLCHLLKGGKQYRLVHQLGPEYGALPHISASQRHELLYNCVCYGNSPCSGHNSLGKKWFMSLVKFSVFFTLFFYGTRQCQASQGLVPKLQSKV